MKIHLDSVGCRLNQAEIERMARQFRAAGHELVASPQGADLAVVNTCAVTTDAAADSRQMLRHIARAGVPRIIPTGCLATLQPKEIGNLPNIHQVVTNDRKDDLVEVILESAASVDPDLEPIARQPLPGLHHRTRAFIKVQDGCDNACTFCVTTVARGAGSSRRLEDVLEDVRFALAGGTKEIVLTGVHLGSWGQDLGTRLGGLVSGILEQAQPPRIRLSSLEPWDLDADFFKLFTNPHLMPHLHLPLQSGSAGTLKRMARKTTPDSFRDLVRAAREVMPEVAITTDVIVGFPGETEAEFAETLDFVRGMDFAGGHVFSYSPRPFTAAAKMKGQTRPEVRKKRNEILRGVFEDSMHAYQRKFLGRRVKVLWESASELDEWGWQMEGWTENYLRVRASAASPRWNELDEVELVELVGDTLRGVIRDSG
jgi:threonylcarbamoyladenosine tRNA methylthiotransferase MtaB